MYLKDEYTTDIPGIISLNRQMARGAKSTKSKQGCIRIIGGQWRGRKLPVLDAEGLRPTTDRNKETLFNWLMPYLSGARVLDLFAGSGGLGLEALSRYAASATFVEFSRQASQQINSHFTTLGLSPDQANLIQGDALKVLDRLTPAFDLVFLDPPFGKDLLGPCIQQLSAAGLVAAHGVIYLERATRDAAPVLPRDWLRLKSKASSAVTYELYQYVPHSNEGDND